MPTNWATQYLIPDYSTWGDPRGETESRRRVACASDCYPLRCSHGMGQPPMLPLSMKPELIPPSLFRPEVLRRVLCGTFRFLEKGGRRREGEKDIARSMNIEKIMPFDSSFPFRRPEVLQRVLCGTFRFFRGARPEGEGGTAVSPVVGKKKTSYNPSPLGMTPLNCFWIFPRRV